MTKDACYNMKHNVKLLNLYGFYLIDNFIWIFIFLRRFSSKYKGKFMKPFERHSLINFKVNTFELVVFGRFFEIIEDNLASST